VPQAIPLIVQAIGAYIGANAVIVAIVAMAAAAVVSSYQGRKAARKARDAYNATLEDRLVMTITADGPRSRIYGRARNVDGVLFKATHGAKSEFYTLVVGIAGHEVDAIEQVYLNDVACTLDADGWVQEAPYMVESNVTRRVHVEAGPDGVATVDLGEVPVGQVMVMLYENHDGMTPVPATLVGTVASAGGFVSGNSVQFVYQVLVRTSHAKVRTFLGDPGQDIGNSFLASRFPGLVNTAGNDDRFAGIACVAVEFTYSQDVFPAGVPSVTAVVRGAKVYDPRTGVTQWTENPALCARDWALYKHGGDVLPSELNVAAVIAAANACDVATVFQTAAGPSASMPLYTCGTVCRLDGNPDVWMDEIVEAMAGKWCFAGGLLTMVAGAWRNPVATITEDWLSGADDIVVVKDPPRSDVVNVYRPSIANKGKYPSATTDAEKAVVYVYAPTPEVRSAAYIADDGQELVREISLAGVTDVIHAQHVCSVLMRDARDGLTLRLPCNMMAYPLEAFDVVRVTLPAFGFDAKEFEVLGTEFSLQGGVILTLKETAASIYDPASGLSVLDAAPNTTFTKPWVVEQVTGVTLASGTEHLLVQSDGTVLSRVLVSWNPLQEAAVAEGGHVEVQWRRIDLEEWESMDAPGDATQVYLSGLQDGSIYLFRLRARNLLNVRGRWSLHQFTRVVGKTAPPANVTGLSAAVVNSGVRLTWNGNTEADYATTELRVGATWVSSSLLFSGKATSYTWLSPSVGSYTVWAKHYDTSANQSVAPASVAVTVTATDAVNWSSIVGRPALFRVVSRGYADTQAPTAAGLYNGETGGVILGQAPMYTVIRLRRSDGVMTFGATYNTLANAGNALSMAIALDATGPDSVVVVYAHDEPSTNRLTPALLAAMKRCGASAGVYGSPQFKYRSAYILVGIGGCGEGNGYEAYSGSIDSDTNAWCEVAFSIQSSQLIVSGTGAVPRTLADYKYTGDLNATVDVRLVARGTCSVSGNTLTKAATGASAWDSDCYSADGYIGGAYVSGVVTSAPGDWMLGLNTDPWTDGSYASIDFAIYKRGDGVLQAYEGGVGSAVLGSWAVGDTLTVSYDGATVRYTRNGGLLRAVAAKITAPLYFDASFYSPGTSVSNVRFGPLSKVADIDTGQIIPEAATEIIQVNPPDQFYVGKFNVLATVNYTVDHTCRIILHATVTQSPAVPGSFPSGLTSLFMVVDGIRFDVALSRFGTTTSLTSSMRGSITVTAPKTVTIGLEGNSNSGSNGTTWSDMLLLVEVIKL
jgi:hypothetical protein